LDIPRRTKIPPPQPIILPGARTPGPGDVAMQASETSPTSDYSPQKPPAVTRTRSLMQRIRKMRDNPNVPVGGGGAPDVSGYYSEGPFSPREGGWTPGPRTQMVPEEPEPPVPPLPGYQNAPPLPRTRTHAHRPSREQQNVKLIPKTTQNPNDERFVLIDNTTAVAASREKALPAPPGGSPREEDGGYFDRVAGQNGIGRKTSLYRKVKGAVVGGNGRTAAK